jgi:hypothetical protein
MDFGGRILCAFGGDVVIELCEKSIAWSSPLAMMAGEDCSSMCSRLRRVQGRMLMKAVSR